MDRSPRAPLGAPPGTLERRPRRPDFLAPEDESDPFDSSAHKSSAHKRAAPRPRRGEPAPSPSPAPSLPTRRAASTPHPGDPQLTLPSMPRLPVRRLDGDDARRERPDEWGAGEESAREWQGLERGGDASAEPQPARRHARPRERTSARPLSLVRRRQVAAALDALDGLARPSAPLVAATGIVHALPARGPARGQRRTYLPVALARPRVARRVRVETQRIAHAARNPWTGLRFALALTAIALALLTATARMGEPRQPLMLHTSWSASGGSLAAAPITSVVRPETQIVQYQLYDSYQQFLDWEGAACSAAATSEVLTAWGVKNATIGQVIDKMVPDISLDGGLINESGFERAAAAYGYRADISHNLTYQQMLYITNQLGLPIIVNVRISYGYYHYFDTGHFLVMTGGDGQGVSIVDSSTYYIHYLPLSVFLSMFTDRTAVIVPQDYHYSVPAI